ncbi:MAG TPA: FKBP-type peptidyl-prolyl cis-trans isomerase [Burkholderiales bacterium]|nr:FKBP-type peptidyl-prolyl cis-trans isomerase [Burkholderiales bacterium]
MTEQQKTLYAVGQVLARQVAVLELTPEELRAVEQGLSDGVRGAKSAVDMSVYGPKIRDLANERMAATAKKDAAAGRKLLARAEAEQGALKGEDGIVYRSLRDGTGASPKASDTVSVNYRGTLPDGKEFDSSYGRGAPAELQLDHVIKCWTVGLQMMKVGGKAKLTCPPETAYGERGARGSIPPDATLTFEIELLGIKKTK